VYRAEQHPRSYIITFPYAYHCGQGLTLADVRALLEQLQDTFIS
jgi:hypothetical protein